MDNLLNKSARQQALTEAVEGARSAYAAANPASGKRFRESLNTMPGGNTRSVLHYAPFPLAFVRGEEASLWSADNDRYVDFLGEFTAGLFGHSHPAIVKALKEAIDAGLGFGGYNLLEAKLAALMCERYPNVERIRFTNSGTEANLLAVSTAVALSKRKGLLVFHGAYHGSVFSFGAPGALGVSINAPFDFVMGDYNDLEGTRTLLRNSSRELAAIMVEPMMGAGGTIPADHEFLRMLREEATSSGALLIFDEVMTARLAPGGLQTVCGVVPDLTTFGKYHAGGMTFGAFGGKAEIMEHFNPGRAGSLAHAGTFNNNVISMAAGVAGLGEVLTIGTLEALNARGDRLRDNLNAVFNAHGLAMQVTGLGSLMTIHPVGGEIHSPADLAAADQLVKELLFFDLVAEGFWLARRGMIALSLPITDQDCDRLVAALERFVTRRSDLLPRSKPKVTSNT
jgi:glutamate-1-semialdehyde 2,1-aminomutase